MEKTIISFVGSEAVKAQLRQWAEQDDRSISAVIRKAIEAEAKRRLARQDKAVK